MEQNILSVEEVGKKIAGGGTLLLAGEEKLLRQLPKGNWIGGTIPYFITPAVGGTVSQDKIFVTDISEITASSTIQMYDPDSLAKVYTDGEGSGFSFIIVPAASAAHTSFALNGPNYKDFGLRPLIGWVSGVHLSDLGRVSPKVFDGASGAVYEQEAVVMHVCLPKGKIADVGIVNIFEQGDGDVLTFTTDGFSCADVMVNGAKENFSEYIARNGLDTKLPIVADYYGALINISFQSAASGEDVKFYAPVFTGIRYKHAKPVTNYPDLFKKQLQQENVESSDIVFSCNCILNYLYSELEGIKTEPFSGPVTFGEIAYQLLNQTLVYLKVYDM